MRLGGQLRVAKPYVIGWDMAAALSLARALGVNTRAAAEWLPDIESAMVRKVNEQIPRQGHEQ
jgi:hypothetical protein